MRLPALVTVLLLALSLAPEISAQPIPEHRRIVRNREPLQPGALALLPLGSVKPQGWLKRQLQIQADGLTGHLDEFWPDLNENSAWLGGAGEGWERGPYYADGLIPLAYLLEDPKLIAKANRWVEWTLTNQRADGSIGPEKNRDWWPNMIMLKVLTQHYEATGDPRVIPLMQRYFAHHAAEIATRPLYEWAGFRWGEEYLSLIWLYNRTGDPKLLDLAREIKKQGFDWQAHFADFAFPEKTTREMLGMDKQRLPPKAMSAHGVNNAMALKYGTLWSVLSGEAADRNAAAQQLAALDRYHLQPNGMYSADEHYAGPSPTQGIELCAVVEAMFSLENVLAVTGDPRLADRLERITFNALPATFTDDMWAHQYDQQPNQVLVSVHPRAWTTNGPESNVFGLEPNFGCCTANMHQGWPKFAASLWMATPQGGLAAVAYAPSEVTTIVRGDVPIRITETTDYPFRGQVSLAVEPASPVRFPLQLRIPSWTESATVRVNGRAVEGARQGHFMGVDRLWQPGDRVEIDFPMPVRATRWHEQSVAIERGPLVYSLKIREDWRKITQGMKRPAPAPAADWEVHPASPWNYALAIDPRRPQVQVEERPIGMYPFSQEGTPITLRVPGRLLPAWTLVNGSAGPLPTSPATTDQPVTEVELIPYGATRLRVTAFPLVRP